MNIVEPIARRAVLQPNKPALIMGNVTLTYSDLMANVAKIAANLSEAGVRSHDVVAVVAPGLVGHVLLTLGVAYVGAVSLPIAVGQADQGEVEMIDVCGASFLAHSRGDGFKLDSATLRGQMSLAMLTQTAVPPVPMAHVEPGEICRLFLSSGTTGRRKPIEMSHQGMLLNALLTGIEFPADSQDRSLLTLGPALLYTMMFWLRSLTSGGAVIAADPTPLEALRKHRATFVLASPVSATALLKVAQIEGRLAPISDHLKRICVGGSAVSPALQGLFRKHICANLALVYGATETGLLAVADAELQQRDPTATGNLVAWAEIQVVGEDGKVLGPGESGRLRVRTPGLANGYPGDESGAFKDGWFLSGDYGTLSREGVLHVGGRGDVLNLSGRKLDPGLVEGVIAQDSAVLECVALTVPGPLGQPQLVAAVVAPQGLDEEALKQRCLAAFGKNCVPKVVILESFPHNEGGKVLRREVQAMAERVLLPAR